MIDKKTVLSFLKKNRIGTIATVTKEGKPDAATIFYLIDNKFEILFITETKTPKFENIQHRDDVVLVVTDPKKKTTAKVRGKASVVTDKKILISVMNLIAKAMNTGKRFDTVFPILKRDDGSVVIIKIKISSIRYSDYSEKKVQEETILL